ncbi:MAG: hypothetical protein OEW08_11815, partial [Gammaproteobacteria bacterium]|nr:hypothetical protein [Gammaproteobacteria bacterium]
MNLDAILVSINAKQVSEMSDPMRVDQTVANARRGLEKCISLGNWWAALHFLLCGEVPIPKSDAIRCGATWFENSLENLLMGGADLPTVKFTGTVRIHNPETVAV